MFSGIPTIYPGDAYSESSEPQAQVGAKAIDKFGDCYRYIQNGAVALVAGKLVQAPAQKTNHHNLTVQTAVAANDTDKVIVTLGATAAVAHEYAGGILACNDVSPEGETYRILGHPAADASATLEVTIDRKFPTALTTSSQVTLVHNRHNGVIVSAGSNVRQTGVPLMDMTIAYYGWVKTKGEAAVLIGTAATLGADLKSDGGSTAGALTDRTDALGASAEPVVAVADIALGVTGEYNPVTLCIDS